MKEYIVYDSRAIYDEDRASIFETLGSMARKEAIIVWEKSWKDSFGVLFEYDLEDGYLINGQRIRPRDMTNL